MAGYISNMKEKVVQLSLIAYVEDGNGTQEEWDLHNLSVGVIGFGSSVVRFCAAVVIRKTQLQ